MEQMGKRNQRYTIVANIPMGHKKLKKIRDFFDYLPAGVSKQQALITGIVFALENGFAKDAIVPDEPEVNTGIKELADWTYEEIQKLAAFVKSIENEIPNLIDQKLSTYSFGQSPVYGTPDKIAIADELDVDVAKKRREKLLKRGFKDD
jgi:hypothetical protein